MFPMVLRESRRARDNAAEIALDQGDAGALHRDVGAGSHGDPDLGLGERRRVVDAVAGHRDDAPLRLELLDLGGLLIRQDLRHDIVDAELLRDRLRGRLAVAGHHDDADPFVVKGANGFGRASP